MSGLSEPADRLPYMERLVLECPVAAVVADAQRRVRFCNPAFERLFLYRAEEATGASLEDLISPRETGDAADAVFRLSRGENVHVTIRARRKDETIVDIQFD